MEKSDVYLIDIAKTYLPTLALGIGATIIGFWVISKFSKILRKKLEKKLSQEMLGLTMGITSATLKTLLLLSTASIIGIEVASLIVVFSSAFLAIGLALKGHLSNFASGILIITLKPFRIGQEIQWGPNIGGDVMDINLLTTSVFTWNGRKAILPNNMLFTNIMLNYKGNLERRLFLTYRISRDEDVDRVKELIQEVIDQEVKNENLIDLKGYDHEIGFKGTTEFATLIEVKVWTIAKKFLPLRVPLIMNEGVKTAFVANKIKTPVPGNQVNIYPSM